MKKNNNQNKVPGYPGMNYKQAKSLATSGPMQQRAPAQFTNGKHNGYFGPQAEAQRRQAKQMNKMQKGLKQTVGNLDITGAQKAKIFDTIEPKKNGPQRGKLGY